MYFKTITLLFVIFLWLGFIASAQKINKNPFTDLSKKIIELAYPTTTNLSLPFSDIEIEDVRQDTSCIAFISNNLGNIHKVDFKNGFATDVRNYIKSIYSFVLNKDSTVNLFVLIKKLWLTDLIAVADNLNPTQTQWNPGIIYEAEFFSEQNGLYHTLYKTDTIIATDISLSGNEGFYVQKAIIASLEKLANKTLSNIKSGKKEFTKEDIQNHIATMYPYAIVKDSIWKKGVYKTFEEFRNNQPSITEFEVKKDSKNDVLYVKENSTESFLLRDCWGYCDGANIYIKTADNFFQLFNSENTFDVKGFKYLKRHKQVKVENILMFGLAGGVMGKGNKRIFYKGDITALQLDIETGELF